MSDATGAPANPNGWDLMTVDGNLNITATREQRFTIRLTGTETELTPPYNRLYTAKNFLPENSYQWKIIQANGSILQNGNAINDDNPFDSSVFNIDTVDFHSVRDSGGNNPLSLCNIIGNIFK